MRVHGASLLGLLVLVAGVSIATPQASGVDGRWKLSGDGVCYFDEADSGPNQCFPPSGRWKVGGDGSCYFDATDGGPDQCEPARDALTAIDEDTVVLLGNRKPWAHSVRPGASAAELLKPAPSLAT